MLAAILRPIRRHRAKKTVYSIADQFLRFHYRFVEPVRSQLRTSDLACWWGQVPTGNGPRTEEREIDVVNGTGTPVVIGMCRWANSEVDFDELNLLNRLARHVEGLTVPVIRYLHPVPARVGQQQRRGLTEYAITDPMLRRNPANLYA